MKNISTLKFITTLTAMAIMGSFGSAHAKSESCNHSNNIEGWGIWCGVESYAAQMAATAAGPSPSSQTQLRLDPELDPDVYRRPPTPGKPERPDFPLTFPEVEDPNHIAGYTWTSTYNKLGDTPGTSDFPQLGTLIVKLDHGGVAIKSGRIQITRYNPAGKPIVSIDLSGNNPLYTATHIAVTRQSTGAAQNVEERFTANNKTLQAYWVGSHSLYSTSNTKVSDTNTHFLAGRLTPISDIEKLAAGNVTATYQGTSAFWQQNVKIDVNFKGKTFHGTWGDSPNRGINKAFAASGDIIGQHIISRRITGADSGFVQGSFFNANAMALGGAYEITKGDTTYNDIFSTFKDADDPRPSTDTFSNRRGSTRRGP